MNNKNATAKFSFNKKENQDSMYLTRKYLLRGNLCRQLCDLCGNKLIRILSLLVTYVIIAQKVLWKFYCKMPFEFLPLPRWKGSSSNCYQSLETHLWSPLSIGHSSCLCSLFSKSKFYQLNKFVITLTLTEFNTENRSPS